MAEDKEKIVIQFDTNADKASKDVDKLTTSITQTEEVTKKSTKANKELKDSTDKAAESSKSQKEALDLVGGGFGTAIEGAKGLIKQFFLLLANPIIAGLAAIVAITTLVFKAFTSTKEGGEALDRAFAAIGATVDVLRDRFLQLVNGIANLSLTEVIASFTGLGTEIQKDAQAASNLTKTLQGVVDAQRDLSVSRSKLNRDLAASKELITDENASYADKKKAIEQVGIANEKQSSAELKQARIKLKAILDQNELSDSLGEALQSSAEAQKAVYDAETERNNIRRSLNKQDKAADRQEAARVKTINDEEKVRLKAVSDAAVLAAKTKKEKGAKDTQDGIDKRKKEAKAREDAAIAARQEEDGVTNQLKDKDKLNQEAREATLIKNGENNVAILKANVAEEDRVKDEQLQQQKNRDDVLASSKASLLGIVANLESSGLAKTKAGLAISKGIALTQIGIDSAVAISKASTLANLEGAAAQAAFPALPGIGTVARVVSYVSTAAQVISNVSRAKQLLSGSGSAGGSGSSSASAPTPRGSSAAPQTGFQPSATNQLATSISAKTNAQPIIKAYVVAQDVTDQQKKDTDLVSQNSFGGVIP